MNVVSVWLLVVWQGYYGSHIDVPNLPSREECMRLGNALPHETLRNVPHIECIEYKTVK